MLNIIKDEKNGFIFCGIIVILTAMISIISIVLNNEVSYPICFISNCVLESIVCTYIVSKGPSQMKTYEIKHLKLNFTELVLALGVISIIGAPLLLKYFDFRILSYVVTIIGLILSSVGIFLEYYLFRFVFKKNEIVEV